MAHKRTESASHIGQRAVPIMAIYRIDFLGYRLLACSTVPVEKVKKDIEDR